MDWQQALKDLVDGWQWAASGQGLQGLVQPLVE